MSVFTAYQLELFSVCGIVEVPYIIMLLIYSPDDLIVGCSNVICMSQSLYYG